MTGLPAGISTTGTLGRVAYTPSLRARGEAIQEDTGQLSLF